MYKFLSTLLICCVCVITVATCNKQVEDTGTQHRAATPAATTGRPVADIQPGRDWLYNGGSTAGRNCFSAEVLLEDQAAEHWMRTLPKSRNLSYYDAGQLLCCQCWEYIERDGEYIAEFGLIRLDLLGNELGRYQPHDPLLFGYTLCPDGGVAIVQGTRPAEGEDFMEQRSSRQLARLDADWNTVWAWEAPLDLQHPHYTSAGDICVFSGVQRDDMRTMYCLSDSGELRWKLDLADGVADSGHSLAEAADGSLYVITGNNKLLHISAAGDVLWTVDEWDGVRASAMESGFGKTNVMVTADGTVVATLHNATVHGVNPDGTPRWSFTVKKGFRFSLASDGAGNVYIGDHFGWIFALDPAGALRWEVQTGEASMELAVAESGKALYNTAFETFEARDATDGSLLWQRQFGGLLTGIAVDPTGNVYLTERSLVDATFTNFHALGNPDS